MSSSNQLKILVGLPAYGGLITAEQAPMWIEWGAAISGSFERFMFLGTYFVDVNPISKARNDLVAHARNLDADWLLMIDADTWVRSNTDEDDAGSLLLRMISDADRSGAAIICAPVVRRRIDPKAADEYMVYREISPITTEEIMSDRPFRIDSCATAVFALNIPHTRRLGGLFQFKDDLSEDLYACRKVREMNGVILCDPRVRTAHKSRSVPLYSR